MKLWLLIIVLILIPLTLAECIDYDEWNTDTKSNIVADGEEFWDYCESDKILIEYGCTDQGLEKHSIKYDCICEDGACIEDIDKASVCEVEKNKLIFQKKGCEAKEYPLDLNYDFFRDTNKAIMLHNVDYTESKILVKVKNKDSGTVRTYVDCNEDGFFESSDILFINTLESFSPDHQFKEECSGRADIAVMPFQDETLQFASVDVYNYDDCKDTDGKANFAVKGVVTHPTIGVVEDRCYNDNAVDFYCEDLKVMKSENFCVYGCKDGVCLQEPQTMCTDTDGGFDIYSKGEIIGKKLVTGEIPKDYCTPNSDDILVEHTCNNIEINGKFVMNYSTQSVICEYGCEDGACRIMPDNNDPEVIELDVTEEEPDLMDPVEAQKTVKVEKKQDLLSWMIEDLKKDLGFILRLLFG